MTTNHKKLMLSGFLCIFLATLLTITYGQNWESYENKEHKITMKVPVDWKQVPIKEVKVTGKAEPLAVWTDLNRQNTAGSIGILVQKCAKKVSLQQVVKEAEEEQRKKADGICSIQTKFTTLGGRKVAIQTVRAPSDNFCFFLRSKLLYVLKDQSIYIVNCFAFDGMYNRLGKTFDEVIKSFRLR